eukprot:gnl/Trimastix_PCT/3024.p1 GENE.gnl/Trimastix_PCT/3024~~gnl/Trimastix_PCT/3024.p1  ORF type:complete len:571 (-),score=94.81 gnl/Trimastix_PCT/3024:48-1760(-)
MPHVGSGVSFLMIMKDALRSFQQELANVNKTGVHVKALSFNFKEWEPQTSRQDQFLSLLRSNEILRATPLNAAPEQPGTIIGSAAAIINVLKHLPLEGPGSEIGLLVAGEGSRLWGVCLAAGAVKGLVRVLGRTLLEQGFLQTLLLLGDSPHQGRDMVLVAGTDNILLPSAFPLHAGQRRFAQCVDRHFFFFSKEMPVLDEQGNPVSQQELDALAQLGVLILGDDGATPIEFAEKAPPDEIVRICRAHGRRSVFINAFIFALTKPAAQYYVEAFTQPSRAGARPLYLAQDFDWSRHVLEPLTIETQVEWDARYTEKQRCVFPDVADWNRLYAIAREFKAKFGPPAAVSIGTDALWYDAGLSKDLVDLHRLALPSNPIAPLLRGLFSLPLEGNVVRSELNGAQVDSNALVVGSAFRAGGRVEPGAIVCDTIFESHVVIPRNTVVIASRIHSIAGSAEGTLIYGWRGAGPLELKEGGAHFTAALRPDASAENQEESERPCSADCHGVFPLDVNPKDNHAEPVFWRHYNANERVGERYISQPFLWTSTPPAPLDRLGFDALLSQGRVRMPPST